MIAILNTEIINFTTIEEKNEFWKYKLQKISWKIKWPEGSIYSGAFLRKLQKSWNWSNRAQKSKFFKRFQINLQKNVCNKPFCNCVKWCGDVNELTICSILSFIKSIYAKQFSLCFIKCNTVRYTLENILVSFPPPPLSEYAL